MKRTAELKRTPFKRKAPLRATPNEAKATVSPKKCKACRQKFFPRSAWQTHCHAEPCAQAALAEATKKRERLEAKAKAAQDKLDKAQKEAMKGIPELKDEAQKAFNKFIRLRDRLAGYACICCKRPLRWDVFGGAVDAGHYRSVGSADNLRFNEDNCHAQRADCNQHGAGRAVDYRLGLIERIGLERVEALEAENKPVKWTRDGLRETRDTYRAKANELQKKINETC